MSHLIRNYFILTISLIIGVTSSFGQTKVVVTNIDETTEEYSLSDNGKIYFGGDILYIDEGDLNPTSFALSDIQKLTFEAINTSIAKMLSTSNIYVYPNPAKENISFVGLSSDSYHISIYSSFGELVLSKNYTFGETINISNLASGIYFVKVNNSLIKFSKK